MLVERTYLAYLLILAQTPALAPSALCISVEPIQAILNIFSFIIHIVRFRAVICFQLRRQWLSR